MNSVVNFSAGPSVLPKAVLDRAAKEMSNYGESGMSVMEMSHRSAVYQGIIDQAEKDLREVMGIPENYTVLFLQGGASLQFAMIPMNLLTGSKKVDLVNTGAWSKKALAEIKRFGTANVLASSEDKTYTYIPEIPAGDPEADYYYITSNNTIYGTRYTSFPDTGNVPLVADMSSNILSEKIDVSRFALIFAGAQKNLGPAGVTVVIIRNDLIGKAPESTPTMLNYATHAKAKSMFNTPPCYSIYMVGLVLQWIKNLGGIDAVEANNQKKANLLYNYLDSSSFFKGTVVSKDRSLMNVPFLSPSEELNKKFIAEATEAGLVNLKGHRTVGGMRASIYNAMPLEGVERLVEFMKQFEKKNG